MSNPNRRAALWATPPEVSVDRLRPIGEGNVSLAGAAVDEASATQPAYLHAVLALLAPSVSIASAQGAGPPLDAQRAGANTPVMVTTLVQALTAEGHRY